MSTSADLAIRSRRAAFNHAIAQGDASAIGPILARDCVMITGTDSAIIAGRNAQVKVWQREFATTKNAGPHNAHRLIYERMPTIITTSPVEPIAMEQGQWRGVSSDSGEVAASGIYSAKWREHGGDWVIEAEIFTTLG